MENDDFYQQSKAHGKDGNGRCGPGMHGASGGGLRSSSGACFMRLLMCLLMVLWVGSAAAYDRTFKVTATDADLTYSPSHPYFELQFTYKYKGHGAKGSDTYRSDALRGAEIKIRTADRKYHGLAWIPQYVDDMKIEYNGEWGVASIVQIVDKTYQNKDGLQWATIRIYPSEKAMLEGMSELFFYGLVDYWQNNKSSNYSNNPTDPTIQHDEQNGDDIVYNNFTIKKVNYDDVPLTGTFDRTPGQITFNITGVTAYRSFTNSDTKDTWEYDLGYDIPGAPEGNPLKLGGGTSGSLVVRSGGDLFDRNSYDINYSGFIYKNLDVKNGSLIGGTQNVNSDTKPVTLRIPTSKSKTVSVQGCSYPTDLQLSPDKWKKSVTIGWNNVTDSRYTDGKWCIYRRLANTGSSWKKVTSLTMDNNSYTDATELLYDTTYEYAVSFARDSWSNLTEPVSDLMVSGTTSINRSYEIKNLRAIGDSLGIRVSWNYPVTYGIGEAKPKFTIYRKQVNEKTFTSTGVELQAKNGTADSLSYVDKAVSAGGCASYVYQISVTLMTDKEFNFVSNSAKRSTVSKVTSVTCSKGTFANIVKVSWDAQQIGTDATKYIVKRRILGSKNNDDYATVYTTQGTTTSYVYDDNAVSPGEYYEYKVEAYSSCSDSYSLNNDMSENGFCQSRGIISGRITYGTGVAVPNAKVLLTTSATDNLASQFYSMNVSDYGDGISWAIDSTKEARIFGAGKAFSIEMWVRPNNGITTKLSDKTPSTPEIIGAGKSFSVMLNPDATGANYNIALRTPDGTESTTKLSIKSNIFSHLTLSTNGAGTWKMRIADSDSLRTDSVMNKGVVGTSHIVPNHIYFGSAENDSAHTFMGYIDEIRVWTKDLTDNEVLLYYGHPLSGTELGLQLYWPLDEGLAGQIYAYDYSKTGNLVNGNLGNILSSTAFATTVPTKDQMSLYGLTDKYGNYVIRGIPFRGEGTNYIVEPLLGTHEFNPQQNTRFVSSSSLNFSSVDFTDVSSFDVSGVVYYKNTNYPLKGAYLYVDGNISAKNGSPVTTDDYGKFDISVPIGDHYITVQKSGHVFCNNGRYPADPFKTGTKHTFDQTMSNLTFYDSTLVCVAGRVAGGDLEKAKDLGLGLGINNIGQAVLKLSAGANYSMNVVPEVKGTVVSYEFGKSPIDVPSSGNIGSTAYRAGGGDLTTTRYIYITTDPKTGEFAAMLPPLEYNLESLQMKTTEGQSHYSSQNFSYTPVGTIKATDPLTVTKDSVWNDSIYLRFSYCTSLKAIYHNDPTFTVRDSMRTDGLFGESRVSFNDGVSASANVDVINGGKYTFGYPVFLKYNPYTFVLNGYEKYTNYDSGTDGVTTIVPLSKTKVTITNQMSSEQSVYINSGTDSQGTQRTAGEFAELKDNTLTLDSLGNAIYQWTAGYPNILSPYTCSLTMTYEYNNAYKDWTLQGNTDNGGLVFGTLPTGNNFVTAGPDQVDMVLRDPPGSASYAFWDKGTTLTTNHAYSGTASSENEFNSTFEAGTSVKTVMGAVTLAMINTAEATSETSVGTDVNVTVGGTHSETKTTTLTTRMSTSGDSGFVGADGDLFIGNSTNLIFGDARQVGLLKNANTQQYEVGKRDVVTTSCQFATEFVYSQSYIENTLIPNLKKLRDALLVTVDQATYNNPNNTTDSLMYITLLKPTDKNYGTSNSDKSVWGNAAVDSKASVGPSYKIVTPAGIKTNLSDSTFVDKVHYYNNSLSKWIKQLRDNEQAKVNAIDKYKNKEGTTNYSFDSGTAIDRSVTYTISQDTTITESFDVLAIYGTKFGATYNKTGVICNFTTKTGVKANFQEGYGTSTTRTTGYHLQSGSNDALSVDVYEPLEGDKTNGPIFYTRAGQTSCPYEGKQMTKYLSENKSIGEATMQVEIPKIKVKGGMNVMSNVPTGSKAVYTLQLSNISETATNGYFNLVSLDKTNQTGAVLSLATGAFGNGHTVYVPANDTVNVVLYLAQGTTDVLDYKNIGIALQSQCESSVADTVYLSAHFVPSSTDITLNIEKRVMNTNTGDTLAMSIRDFDATYKGLKDILVQCRGEGEVNWKTVKRYVINKADSVAGDLVLPNEGIINLNVDMSNSAIYPDQTYLFRAVTETTYGSGYITKTSDEISVVKDMQKPKQLGLANPSDGILSPGDEISVVFNESIKGSALNEATDFIVTGILNGAKVAHSVALKMENTDQAAASTEAEIRLAGKSFAVDMWVNCTGAGTLFSHGNGSNKFTVGTNSAGNLVLGIGGNTYTSKNVVPQNKWVFLTFNYTYDPSTGIFSAMVANDDATTMLFNSEKVPQYDGVGGVSLGRNITGAMHEVALWDRARSVSEAQSEMYVTKLPSTPYLIGYWKFDEGEGLKATDYARSRNMKLSTANWYLNNVNKAVTLNGSRYLALDISACSALATDDYAYEMWFKGAKQSGAATLFSTSDNVAIGFDASGKLQLLSNGTPTTLSTTDYLDNAWHHIALNVLRNGNGITYVDGTAVAQLSASAVAPMQGSAIYVGAESYLDNTGTYQLRNYFTGAVDELRFWKATLSASVIRANRLKRLTGKEAGLVAYYPFEIKTLDGNQQVIAKGSEVDAVSDSIKIVASDKLLAYTDEAPALKENLTETNVPFTYVTSDNRIVISFDENKDKSLAAKLEGCTLNFCVRNVRDANDNISEPIYWSAYVRQNQLLWADDGTSLKQKNQEETTFTATFSNQSSANENWSLSNIPSWLTASETQGTLKPLSTKTITFTVSSATPIGKYEETIYLSGNKAISEPYTIDLEVSGDEPNWTVDKSAYETNMNIIGQLKVMGVPSEDVSDKVAAFIDGQCRGVASPVYYQRYDSYYTIMDIYGNASDAGKSITFKVWDASTGIIYPTVDLSYVVGFTADKVTGDMTNPFIWNAKDQIEQDIALSKGWNWISLNMTSTDMTVSNVLSGIKSATEVIKGKTAFSQPSGDDWAGKLTRFYVGDMYKIKTTAPTALTMTGTAVKAVNEPITIQPNWNWIGCNTTYNMTVADAFAGITPTDGDQVKGQTGFALYQKYGWVGTLKSIVPGKGYMYLSKNTQPVTFTYPSSASTTASLAPAYAPRQAGVYTPVSENAFPGNMTMVAKVVNGNSVISGAEVGVFASDGCRSDEVSNSDGIVFLTIAGEGTGEKLTFKVYNGGSTTEVDQGLIYIDDATYGTMSAPYLIQMDPTAINSASAEGVHVYPTRVVSDVNVDASNIKRITLQDTGGRLLFSRTTNLTEHNVISMSEYADGIYFVVVQTATQGTVIRRILKMAK